MAYLGVQEKIFKTFYTIIFEIRILIFMFTCISKPQTTFPGAISGQNSTATQVVQTMRAGNRQQDEVSSWGVKRVFGALFPSPPALPTNSKP